MTQWHGDIDCSHQVVIGVDEAGRGSLAGPVVAASVILDAQKPIIGLNDSKKLSAKMRDQLYEQIMTHALFVAVEAIDADVIDRINILRASLLAMQRTVIAVSTSTKVDLVLVDGNQKIPDVAIAQKTIIGGDGLVPCIMAASIIAKVHRDRLMHDYEKTYPGYGFAKHKGYGTKTHLAAIDELGPSAIHRMSYAPLRAAI